MRSSIIVLGLSLLVTLGLGCGGPTRYRAQGTPHSPGTDAELFVGKTDGASTIDLQLEHLTDPARLTPGATQYVVWVVPEGGQPIYTGSLRWDRGAGTGRLRATTPYERFDLMVTAEPERVGAWPTGALVVERRVP